MSKQSPAIRLGEILVERGVLTEQQVFEILQKQKTTHFPFGVLAERMFDVTVTSIEDAWVEQYVRENPAIDLRTQRIDEEALRTINARQAWQFEILPLRFEPSGELLMAATRHRLARAVSFAARRIKSTVLFNIAQSAQLRDFLRKHYPMPEVTEEILEMARRWCRAQDQESAA
ncbi:MAG: hypothetical protein JJU36_14380 [Phycisphaeraceae bacterium]|nr:hypothetical protein [Phycisphaeraceae bacterium]